MVEAKVSGKNVVIKLPIDWLVHVFNYKDDNHGVYQVKNKRKFAEGVVEYLLYHSNNSETGLTVFQEMLDGIFDEMVCDAQDYIKELEVED